MKLTAGPLEPGQLLAGRYRVVRPLQAGGMGAVYEAEQEDLGRQVALKVIADVAISPSALARFRVEAEAAARLGHPHIVQVSAFHHEPGEPPFMVMELLRGESLGTLLRREGRMHWTRAARIGAQVLDALAAAHAARIIHRDIKPDNVFLVASSALTEIAKVVDFGVAKLLEPAPGSPQTYAGAIVGTIAYMAPEQARGEPVDARSDQYSVGVCLYQAACGRRPIEVAQRELLLAAIAAATPTPLRERAPDVDVEFARIVDRALARDPSERHPSAEAMASALARRLAEVGGAFADAGAPQTYVTPPMDAPTAAGSTAGVALTTRSVVGSAAPTVSVASPPNAPHVAPTLPMPSAPRTMAPPRTPSSTIVGMLAIAAFVVVVLAVFGIAWWKQLEKAPPAAVAPVAASAATAVAVRAPAPSAAPASDDAISPAGHPAWFDEWEARIVRTDWTITTVGFGEDQSFGVRLHPYAAYDVSSGGRRASVRLVLAAPGVSAASLAGERGIHAKPDATYVDHRRGAFVFMDGDRVAAQKLLAEIRP